MSVSTNGLKRDLVMMVSVGATGSPSTNWASQLPSWQATMSRSPAYIGSSMSMFQSVRPGSWMARVK